MVAGGHYSTSLYMRSFWAGKTKVPMMETYNQAISDSLNVIDLLYVLSAGWGAISVSKLLGL